ncbi:AAA family ATPase [Eudoraea algarum]|uniref:AAA family ATPase n=1 Tax=Eudoraea algarum TaxID=3417568 RepID=UPI003F5D4E70
MFFAYVNSFGTAKSDETKRDWWLNNLPWMKNARRKREEKKVDKAKDITVENPEGVYVSDGDNLDRLSEVIINNKMVCVLGPSGVGKTRLVQQVCHSGKLELFKKKFEIDLEDVNPPDNEEGETVEDAFKSARNAFNRGINLEQNSDLEMIAMGISVPTLIFIDNYEQIVQNNKLDAKIRKELIDPFRKNEKVHIIITSRISIYRAKLFELKPLKNAISTEGLTIKELADRYSAIKLFFKIHNQLCFEEGRTRKKFNENDCQIIIELCNSVSSLPLGIRLLAVRSIDKELIDIKQELQDTLKQEIPIAFGDLSDRQRSLYNAFSWSFNLLKPEEKRFFAYLSFFKNGFFLKNLPIWPSHQNQGETKDTAIMLFKHSLLRYMEYPNCSEPKYEMYVFARQMLEITMDSQDISLQHEYLEAICHKYLDRIIEIERLIFGKTSQDLNYIEIVKEVRLDLENIENFIKWCTKHRKDLAVDLLVRIERVLNETGPYIILKELYDPLLQHFKDGVKRSRLLMSKARVVKSTNLRHESMDLIIEAINILEAEKSINSTLGECYRIGTYLSAELGKFELRESIIEKVLNFSKEQQNALGISNYAFIILEDAKRYEKRGELKLAKDNFQKAAGYLEGYNVQLGKVLNYAGIFSWRIGDAEMAETYFKRCIKNYQNLGEDRWILGFKTNLALLYADTGDLKRGKTEAEEAYNILKQEGPYGWFLINKQSNGRLLARMSKSNGRFKEAEEILLESYQELKEVKYHESMVLGSTELAELYYLYEKYDLALDMANRSVVDCETYGLAKTMRYFRALCLDGLTNYRIGNTEVASKRKIEAEQLLVSVRENNWLTYGICYSRWQELKKLTRAHEPQ